MCGQFHDAIATLEQNPLYNEESSGIIKTIKKPKTREIRGIETKVPLNFDDMKEISKKILELAG